MKCIITHRLNIGVLDVLEIDICYKPYLNTTTSKQVENTQAFELTIIKELGKMTP